MKITVLSDGHGKNGSSLFIQFSENSGLDNNINEKTPVLIDLGPGYEIGIKEYLERIGKTSNKRLNVLITHTHADHFCPENLFYQAYSSGIKEIDFYGPGEGEYENGLENKLLTKNTSEYILNSLNSKPITGKVDLKVNCYNIYPLGSYENSAIQQKQTESLEMEKVREIDGHFRERFNGRSNYFVLISNKTYSITGIYGKHVIPTISGFSIEELFFKIYVDKEAAKSYGINEKELGRKIAETKKKIMELYKQKEVVDVNIKSCELVDQVNKNYEEKIIKLGTNNVKVTYITDTGLYFENGNLLERFQTLARNSDLLIVGANKFFQEQENTGGKYHLSIKDAILLKDSSNSKRLSLMHFPWSMENFIGDLKYFFTGLKKMSKHQKEAFQNLGNILLNRNDIYIAYSGVQYEITPNDFKVKNKKWMK